MKMGKVYVLLACLAAGSVVMGQTTINVGTDTGWSGISPKPTSIDTVVIRANATVTLDENAVASILRVNNQNSPTNGTLLINQNYSLNVGSLFQLGTATGAGVVTQSDGSVSAGTIVVNNSGTGDLSRYDLSGGTVSATTSATVRNAGQLNISGGTFSAAALTADSGGAVNLSGGTLNMNGTLTANGTVTINGGMISNNIAGVGATGRTMAGGGAIKMLSGSYALTGGAATDVVQINTALFEISGGAVNLSGQVRVGAGAEMKIIGNDATIQFGRLNNQGTQTGTFRFVFDEDGVSTVNSAGYINLSAATLIVDGSAFTGEAGTFDLFKGTTLSGVALADNISVSGFDSYGGAYVTQDVDSGLVQLTVIPEPATVGLFIVASVGLMILRRLR